MEVNDPVVKRRSIYTNMYYKEIRYKDKGTESFICANRFDCSFVYLYSIGSSNTGPI